jgi:hypothetical protein
MNLGKLGMYATGAFASLALVIACSSSSSSSSGGTGDGGSSGSSGTPPPSSGSCAPANGTYTTTYTADASNSATCLAADKLDSTNDTVDSSDKDAGPGCQQTESGCTVTTHCVDETDGGPTTTLDGTATVASDGATTFSGSISVVTSGGGVDQTCKYTFTAKKN